MKRLNILLIILVLLIVVTRTDLVSSFLYTANGSLFFLLGIIWLVIIPLMGMRAYFRTHSLEKRIAYLEEEFNKHKLFLSDKKTGTTQENNIVATHNIQTTTSEGTKPSSATSAEVDASKVQSQTSILQNTHGEQDNLWYEKYQSPSSKKTGASNLSNEYFLTNKISKKQSSLSNLNLEKFEESKFTLWFKDNWAGLVGVSIVVLGIIFGALYVGASASPFIRFIELIGVAIALLITGISLRRTQTWSDLGEWLQSASGAIFLFAALGSASIPSLSFYTDEIIGYGLLFSALIFNLGLSLWASKENVATLHILMCLSCLILSPYNILTYNSAAFVTFIGIYLSMRREWNINLILSWAAFSLFQFFFTQHSGYDVNYSMMGVSTTFLLTLYAILTHYQKPYAKIETGLKTKEALNSMVHISLWIISGFQFLMYQSSFNNIWIFLGLLAVLGVGLGHFAKQKGLAWLFHAEVMCAQICGLFGIFALSKIGLSIEYIYWLVLLESLAFSFMYFIFNHALITYLSSILFFSFTVMGIGFSIFNPISANILLMISTSLLALIYAYRYYQSSSYNKISTMASDDKLSQWPSIYYHTLDLSFLIISTFTLWQVCLFEKALLIASSETSLLFLAFPVFLLSLWGMSLNTKLLNHFYHKGLLFVLVVEAIILNGFAYLYFDDPIQTSLLYSVPTLLLLILFNIDKFFSQISFPKLSRYALDDAGIYLMMSHLLVCGTFFLIYFNPFLPGAYLLAVGLLIHEIGHTPDWQRLSERGLLISHALINSAHLYFYIFSGFYFLLYISSEASLYSVVSVRIIFTLIAILTLLFWHFSTQTNQSLTSTINNRQTITMSKLLGNVDFDIAILFIFALLWVEFNAPVHPIGYGVMALLLSNPKLTKYIPARADYYAKAITYILCFQVAIVSSQWASPSSNWYELTHITGPVSFILAFLSTIQITNNNSIKTNQSKPFKANMLLIPIFISMAFFLMWRFDKAFLTLLWVSESFAMISLAYALKDKWMANIGYAFLIFCNLRLLFYDLAQTDLLIRSIVFVMVGLLMIFIHMIHKKYAGRLA